MEKHEEFRSATTPSKSRELLPRNANIVLDILTLPQLLLTGMLLELLIVMLLPFRHAALLALALVALNAFSIFYQATLTPPESWKSMEGVLSGRVAAQIPKPSYNSSTGQSIFGHKPSSQGILIFLLGARINHPLGVLASGSLDVTNHKQATDKALFERAREYGCLGSSEWRANERATCNTILTVYYFRNVEGLNAFARDPVHRAATEWYNDWAANLSGQRGKRVHIGIFHEAFYAPPGSWESIYVNMPPTLLGGTSSEVMDLERGETEFVRNLVDASKHSGLRTQFTRMGRQQEGAWGAGETGLF